MMMKEYFRMGKVYFILGVIALIGCSIWPGLRGYPVYKSDYLYIILLFFILSLGYHYSYFKERSAQQQLVRYRKIGGIYLIGGLLLFIVTSVLVAQDAKEFPDLGITLASSPLFYLSLFFLALAGIVFFLGIQGQKKANAAKITKLRK
ncbi:hypothetical protein ACFQHW_04160 [Lapidilactobacillus achengensis]|uniref:Uncharacterized protein n=2 Tax=Lapidilactobacillus achengensis TaxID=2486000 RepID=A0ABW1UP20_9LACO